ncbi:NmrA family NAD(P)-binding protein [Oenococcus sicerae]|nr:NmrA family NAD(P)-binding protein [Oenococcus sicerae]QAS69891.2 NmrA family NAD(P)-binding protein [Oenococcus sicerae]
MKVFVTASYGRIAHHLIPMLAKNGVEVRAVDPDSKNVQPLKDLGASEVIVGDLRRDEIIDKAMHGIDKIFLILPDAMDGVVSMSERLINAAKREHVKHFVFSSCMNTVMELLQHWEKYEVEDMLMGSTLNYTILKPSGYMEMHFPTGPNSAFETGEVTTFIGMDQPGTMISLEDIAAAACKVLLSQDEYYYASLDLCSKGTETMREDLEYICSKIGKEAKVNMISAPDTPSVHANDMHGRMMAYHSNHPYVGNPFDFNALMGYPAKTFKQYADEVIAGIQVKSK